MGFDSCRIVTFKGGQHQMNRVCVFCGSSNGFEPAMREDARALGKLFAERGIGLVYGGASVGLMGAIADAVLKAGGAVFGVIPESLQRREIAHLDLTELHVVPSMHARKLLMSDLSDAFVALPGGIGTLEELFEVWTWAQLGLHAKPVALLNLRGFYDPLLQFLDQVVSRGFMPAAHRDTLIVESQAEALLDRLLR
jgi:uncharacterized protein (TIGR00730 family)